MADSLRPFFSVVITTYNRADQLLNCIESVRRQVLTDYEILVVDDCSTDNTAALVQNLRADITFLSTAVNSGGPAMPRNLGLQAARGEWVCFCDSDDSFLPTHLDTYHAFIREQQLSDGILTGNAIVASAGRATGRPYFRNAGTGFTRISLPGNWNCSKSILSSLCIHNTRIVPFREDPRYQSVEDYVFLVENMLQGKKHFRCGQPTIIYNDQSADSIRELKGNGQRMDGYKMELFRDYRLHRNILAPYYLAVIVRDKLKRRIKQLARSGREKNDGATS